ncbi:MAG: hypothetical protein JNK38_06325 [Acidobacteria bacterium]|nr:hypothetical protein [Acidobacteriota bacterium]
MDLQTAAQPNPTTANKGRFQQLAIALLMLLSLTTVVGAQAPAQGSRLFVAPLLPGGVASINQGTSVEIKFLDPRGYQTPAPANIKLTLTATVLNDLNAAKRVAQWQTKSPLDRSGILLDKTSEAAVVQGEFPAGASNIWISVKSERGGVVRVFAEAEGLISGNAAINVQGPSRLAIATTPTSISRSSSAKVEISLLDFRGAKVKADADYQLTVTATLLGSFSEVTQAMSATAVQQTNRYKALLYSRSLEGQTLMLARNQQWANVTGKFPKDKDKVTLTFRSYVPGTVRLYVEAAGLVTAGLPVAVAVNLPESSAEPPANDALDFFSFAPKVPKLIPAWQPAVPAPAPVETPKPSRLKIEGYNVNEVIRDSYRFKVFLLDQNDLPIKAAEEVPLKLSFGGSVKGKVEFTQPSVSIPAGSSSSPPVELKSSCHPNINLIATSQVPGIAADNLELNFNPPRRATRLGLITSPGRQIASGLNAISLSVTAFNDCGDVITAQEENLGAGRSVFFTYDRYLNFDKDDPTLFIPADKASDVKKVFSSHSVEQMEITGTDQISQVQGKAPVTFYFPWRELFSAMLGGLIWPLIAALPKFDVKGLVRGGFSGIVMFGLALFGAIVTEQAKLGELTVNLLRLPVSSWFPAAIMGFIGYSMLEGALALKAVLKKSVIGKNESEA